MNLVLLRKAKYVEESFAILRQTVLRSKPYPVSSTSKKFRVFSQKLLNFTSD